MCGIAFVLSAGSASGTASGVGGSSPASGGVAEEHGTALLIDGLKVALGRRGPDSLGIKRLFLQLESAGVAENEGSSLPRKGSRESFVVADGILPSVSRVEGTKNGTSRENDAEKIQNSTQTVTEVISRQDTAEAGKRSSFGLHFLGATLHLRGINAAAQPLIDESGNILVYNGEVFGGIHIDRDENDGKALLDALKICEEQKYCCVEDERESVCHTLSSIKGPWALIYWQAKSRTLWFGRDAFGRRSLLVCWPSDNAPQFILSSVSPLSTAKERSDGHKGGNFLGPCHDWEELSCGIYSLCLESSKGIQKHQWKNARLNNLIRWERRPADPHHHVLTEEKRISPSQQDVYCSIYDEVPVVNEWSFHYAQKLLNCLRESVMRRTSLTMLKTAEEASAPLALLFSGGLDSMILAALSHQCLDQQYAIDLLNVSFDGPAAPDRMSAREGLKELQGIDPSRRWRLVEIDGDLSSLASETKHVMSLIHPANTFMDLNIGLALWLAAGGEGFVDGELYKSTAKIVLVGAGADEQCAGYGRHRTKFRLGGWAALEEEMRMDMQRIWIRNMGRDDRCISDHGKEARFPFLDEDVVDTLLEIPLCEIADLDQPSGLGDKKILREVARLLGLQGAAVLPKRAIQFGSRIARESNKIHFGSNRAANQASAGGAAISRAH